MYILTHTDFPIPLDGKQVFQYRTIIEGIAFDPSHLLQQMNDALDALLTIRLNNEAGEAKKVLQNGVEHTLNNDATIYPVLSDKGELYGYSHYITRLGFPMFLVETYQVVKYDDQGAGEPKIFVELWRGLLSGVYTDIPGNPALICLTTGEDDTDEETQDKEKQLQQLKEQYRVRKIDEDPNWFITDSDNWQCCRLISERQYEFIQICGLGEEYGVAKGTVNLDDYSAEQVEGYLKFFGYKDIRHFVIAYKMSFESRIFAEMVFETGWEDYLLDNRLSTFEQARDFIADIVDCALGENE